MHLMAQQAVSVCICMHLLSKEQNLHCLSSCTEGHPLRNYIIHIKCYRDTEPWEQRPCLFVETILRC